MWSELETLDVLEARTMSCETIDLLKMRKVLAPLHIRNHTPDGVEGAGSTGNDEIRCEMFDVLELLEVLEPLKVARIRSTSWKCW